ncbi:hypothetical protein OIU78_003710 [Salix suchowensis]|nr:transcription elongation factor TFIIS [Salix suchowensis]KAJ6363586.1 hypothetical protein OIU78_003710 [Salix suchowensis]
MEQKFLSLFESAKTSADIAVTSSMNPEVHRCLTALGQLKRFPVLSSRVLLSTPVAKQIECLTRHPVKMIKNAASCLLDTWKRKLYARHPVTQQTKSGGVSRTGTLIVKMRGRVLGRVKVGVPIKAVQIEGKKIEEETGKGLGCFKKSPLVPAKQARKPEKVENTRSCFKKPSLAPAKKIIKPAGKVESIKNGFKKPPQASAKRVAEQEKVKGFGSFKKPPQASTMCITAQEDVRGSGSLTKPSKEPVKCDDAFRGKVRSVLVESLSRVAKEAGAGLRTAVSSRDPICVAADVESVMFQKMGPFNGAKTVKYRSILFNLKDPKNPDLRRKVLLGQIKPEKLVTMTSEDMASNQRQFENAEIRMKSLLKEKKKAQQENKYVDPLES